MLCYVQNDMLSYYLLTIKNRMLNYVKLGKTHYCCVLCTLNFFFFCTALWSASAVICALEINLQQFVLKKMLKSPLRV